MEEALYAGEVPVNDFKQLVIDCGFSSQHAFTLVEQLPARVIKDSERKDLLSFTHFNPEMHFEIYTSGRFFDEHAELRWEMRGNLMQVV